MMSTLAVIAAVLPPSLLVLAAWLLSCRNPDAHYWTTMVPAFFASGFAMYFMGGLAFPAPSHG
jgi:hypothetical protein